MDGHEESIALHFSVPNEEPLLDPSDGLPSKPNVHHHPTLLKTTVHHPRLQTSPTREAYTPFKNYRNEFVELGFTDDAVPTPDEPERPRHRSFYPEEESEGFDESRSEWPQVQNGAAEYWSEGEQGHYEDSEEPDLHDVRLLGSGHRRASHPQQKFQKPVLVPCGPLLAAEEDSQRRRKGYKCGVCGLPKKGHMCQKPGKEETGQANKSLPVPRSPLLSTADGDTGKQEGRPQAARQTLQTLETPDSPRRHPSRLGADRLSTPQPLSHTPSNLRPASPSQRSPFPTPPSQSATQSPSSHKLSARGQSLSKQLFRGPVRPMNMLPALPFPPPASPASSSSSNEGHRRARQVAYSQGARPSTPTSHPRRSGIHALPHSCLVQILSKLPPRTLALTALVSRRWHSCSGTVWTSVEDVELVLGNWFAKPGQVSAALGASRHVTEVLRRCVRLRRLVLTVTGRIEDAVLRATATSRPELTDLEIRLVSNGVNVITGAGIGFLIDRCRSLRSLKADGCKCVSRVKIRSQELTTLWLAGCDRLLFLELECPQMRELALDLNPQPGFGMQSAVNRDMAAATLVNLMKQMRSLGQRLERLHLSSPYLSDQAVAVLLARKSSNMRALSLTQGPDLTDVTADVIRGTCPNLEVLDLSGSSVTDVGLRQLATQYSETLRSLLIAGCTKVTEAGLYSAVLILQRLELLDCGFAFTETPAVFQKPLQQPHPRFLSGNRIPNPNLPNLKARGPVAQRGALFQAEPHTETGPLTGPLTNRASNKRSAPSETPDENAPHEKKQKGDDIEAFPPPGIVSLQSETLAKLSLWGCSRIRTLELECPALTDLNLKSCTNLNPGNISLRCRALERVHVAGCGMMVGEAIQEQLLAGHWLDSDPGSDEGSGSVGVRRQADGTKRVQALRQAPQQDSSCVKPGAEFS